jgi:hypothetical protein
MDTPAALRISSPVGAMARLVPTVTLEAVIAWLDIVQPDSDRAGDYIGGAVQAVIEAARLSRT